MQNFSTHTHGLTRQSRAGVCHFIIYFVHIKRSFCSHLKNICCRIRIFLFSFSIFANPFILFKAGSFGYGNEKLQLNRATTIDFQQPKQTYFMLIREWIATINCCDVQHAQQNINQLGIYASVYCVLCMCSHLCALKRSTNAFFLVSFYSFALHAVKLNSVIYQRAQQNIAANCSPNDWLSFREFYFLFLEFIKSLSFKSKPFLKRIKCEM